MNVELNEGRYHFFVLHVHEDRSRNPSILVTLKARNEFEARQLFPKMRPKTPILEPKKYYILDAYDTEDMPDMTRLKLHQHGRQILFYIEESKIGTLCPRKVLISVDDLEYRKNETNLIHVSDKSMYKIFAEKQHDIENKLQETILSMKTNTILYNTKDGEFVIKNCVANEKNLSFILYNKTMGELITFAENVYKIAKGSKIIIEFFYYENEQLYRCEFGEELVMKKM